MIGFKLSGLHPGPTLPSPGLSRAGRPITHCYIGKVLLLIALES